MLQRWKIPTFVVALGLIAAGASGCTGPATGGDGGASSVSVELSSSSGSFKAAEMVTAEPSWGTSTDATAANVGDVVCEDVSLSGKQLTVRDNDGKTVGLATLGSPDAQDVDGTLVANSAYAEGQYWGRVSIFATAKCVTKVSVDISGESDFYSITVAGVPGEMQYDSDDFRSGVSLSY